MFRVYNYEEKDGSFLDDLMYIYNVNTYRNELHPRGGGVWPIAMQSSLVLSPLDSYVFSLLLLADYLGPVAQ